MDAGSSNNDTDIFVYMGEDSEVPRDVVSVRIHPSVKVIPNGAFRDRKHLKVVDISEGVVEIGQYAFSHTMMDEIRIASTVKHICRMAFNNAKARSIILPEGLESIGYGAFCGGMPPPRFRIPPRITTLSEGMLYGCRYGMISLELPEGVRDLTSEALGACSSLRNVALPSDSSIDFDNNVFGECTSLEGILGSEEQIVNALQHRFDNLPIHKMIYYQSYNNMTLEQLNDATNMRSGSSRSLRSKLDPSGNLQDTLGMTPLHILACSTVQNVDMYRIIIEKYPDNLITKDKWGALPILYAIWGQAPDGILWSLINSYRSLYPNFVFDSDKMFETLARADAPWEVLAHVDKLSGECWGWNCEYWQSLLEKLVDSTPFSEAGITPTAFQFLAAKALAPRLKNLGCLFDVFVAELLSFEKAVACASRRAYLNEVMSELEQFESKYHGMKDATTQLELALWTKKIEESVQMKKRPRKAKKSDASSSVRSQCRINCGANIIIPLVLPYLVPAAWNPSSRDDDDSLVSIPP